MIFFFVNIATSAAFFEKKKLKKINKCSLMEFLTIFFALLALDSFNNVMIDNLINLGKGKQDKSRPL